MWYFVKVKKIRQEFERGGEGRAGWSWVWAMRYFCLLFSLLSIQSISYFILSTLLFSYHLKKCKYIYIYNIYSIWSVLCFSGHIGMAVLRIYGRAKNPVIDLLNWFVFTTTTLLSLCQLCKGQTATWQKYLFLHCNPSTALISFRFDFSFARGEGQEWEWVGGLFEESKSAFVRSLRWRWWGGTLWYHPSLARTGCDLRIQP